MARQGEGLRGGQFGFFSVAVLTLAAMAWNGPGERVVDSREHLDQASQFDVVSSPTAENPFDDQEGLLVPSHEAESAPPDGVDSDWWGQVQGEIAQSEYQIRWQDGAGAYQSPNRAQNLRFTYRGDGFSAEPRTCGQEASPWKLGMRLSAWGRGDNRKAFKAGAVQTDVNRAEAEGQGITVMYKNDRDGMRQDFLIRERPAGSGPLQLWLDLDLDGVAAEVEPDGRG